MKFILSRVIARSLCDEATQCGSVSTPDCRAQFSIGLAMTKSSEAAE